jgi:hypothetical protein
MRRAAGTFSQRPAEDDVMTFRERQALRLDRMRCCKTQKNILKFSYL